MLTATSETEVLAACRTLFGSGVRLSRDFLNYLQPSGAKSVYRKRAKETHPDLFASLAPAEQKTKSDNFRELSKAYEVVTSFLKAREKGEFNFGNQYHTGYHHQHRTTPKPRRRQRSDTNNKRFYQGNLPQNELGIGIFLYYRGKIPYSALIQSLVWQRRQRPSIGDIANKWGWLEERDITRIIRCRAYPGRFGDRATRLGLLSPQQVRTLLFFQRSQQQRLGEYFVEKGFLSAEEMDLMVEELREHNLQVSTRRTTS